MFTNGLLSIIVNKWFKNTFNMFQSTVVVIPFYAQIVLSLGRESIFKLDLEGFFQDFLVQPDDSRSSCTFLDLDLESTSRFLFMENGI